MGEFHEVSLTSDDTGPLTEGAEEIIASEESENAVSVPTDQERTVDDLVDRPVGLPEKFNSVEDMAEAYNELETRLGAPKEEDPIETIDELSSEIGSSPEAMQPFYDEYAASGELSEASFDSLAEMGLSKDLVENFMEGQKAIMAQQLGNIYSVAGGEAAYNEAVTWATNSMSEAEIEAYNEQVETGDITTALVAVKGLMARYKSESGQPANLLNSEATNPGGMAAYESLEQLMQDMQSHDYKNDPAFRAKVQRRLQRSNIM